MCEANSPSGRTSKTWTGEIHNEPFLRENKFLCKHKHIFKRRQFHKTFSTSRAKRFKRKILLQFCLIRWLLLWLLRVIEADSCRSFTLWIWKRFVKSKHTYCCLYQYKCCTVTRVHMYLSLTVKMRSKLAWLLLFLIHLHIFSKLQQCSICWARPWVYHTV